MKLKELVKLSTEEVKELDMNAILTCIKEGITSETMDLASEAMQMGRIKSYVAYLVGKKIANEAIGEADYQNLYLLIHILQTIYNYSGADTGVSDQDYDRLYELLQNYGMELITTPNVVSTGAKLRKHKYPTLRGTLAKIYALDEEDATANKSRDTLAAWVARNEKRYKEATGIDIDLWEEEIYVFPKWDGVSVEFEMNARNEIEHALLRGDTEANEAKDVTFIFSTLASRIRDENMTGRPYGLKTEVMMYQDDFKVYNERYGTTYKDTRSIVSSIVNSDTLDGRENLLEIVRLRTSVIGNNGEEMLQELATNVFERPYLRCRLKDTIAIKKFAYAHRSVDGLNCDGAVLYIIDPDIRKVLGRENHKNRYEVAFKFNEDIAYTKIKSVTFSTTEFGRVFPTANFEMVKMKGREIKNASLGSMARFNELHLAKGDTVKILYEIIPYLAYDKRDEKCKRSGKPPIEAPTHCPECDEPLEINYNGTILSCINPDCPCRKKGKITNYITKMGMKGIGPSTVSTLYDEGFVKKIEDLYTLKEKEKKLKKLDGFDTIFINNIINAIESKRHVSAEIFMSAIGIECVGKKTFSKIFEKYTIEDLLEFAEDQTVSNLVMLKGISDLTAHKILKGVDENQKTIQKLMNILDISYAEQREYLFKAIFHKIRSELVTNMIKEHGGTISENLTKDVDFIIVPNGFNEETSKSKKAKEWGIPLVELDRVPAMLDRLMTETDVKKFIQEFQLR